MSTDAIMVITQVCSAILGVSAVIGIATKVFVSPRIREVDAALVRIENHLIRLNGSVAEAVKDAAAHEVRHIRRDSDWPGTP